MRKLIVYLIVFSIAVFSQCSFAFAASNLEEGIKQLAEQISKNMQEKQKQKIAIIDFSDLNGNVTALGQFMAEELTTQLFMIAPGKFEVVERRQLMKLEEELVLGQVGIIEEKGIKKMGQVLGVDAIVTGSMTDLGNTVKINARLIAVESAKVFAVAATDIPKTGMVADLIGKQVEGRQTAAQNKPTGNTPAKQEAKVTKGIEKIFQNDLVKVTVKGLKKTKSSAALILIYEDMIEDKSVKIAMGSSCTGGGGGYRFSKGETFLLDENGERWDFKEDSANAYGQWKELIPKTKLTSKATFIPQGDSNGSVFTLTTKFCGGNKEEIEKTFTVILNDIATE